MYVCTNIPYTFTPDSQPHYYVYTIAYKKCCTGVVYNVCMYTVHACVHVTSKWNGWNPASLTYTYVRTYSIECELMGSSEFVCPMHTTQAQVPNGQQGLKGLL